MINAFCEKMSFIRVKMSLLIKLSFLSRLTLLNWFIQMYENPHLFSISFMR